MPLYATVHLLYTRSTDIFGASVSEAAILMRLNPRFASAEGLLGPADVLVMLRELGFAADEAYAAELAAGGAAISHCR